MRVLALLCALATTAAYTPYAAKAIAKAPTPAAAARLRFKYARKESCQVRQQLGARLALDLGMGSVAKPAPVAGPSPYVRLLRAVQVLLRAFLSVFSLEPTHTPQRTRPAAHIPRPEKLMPAQRKSLDLWFDQYQRTRDIGLKSSTTPDEPAPPAATAPPPRPEPVVVYSQPPAPEPYTAPEPYVQSTRWSDSMSAITSGVVAPLPKPAKVAKARLESSSGIDPRTWQAQGLAAQSAALRKQQKIDDFLASKQKNRLGGARA